MHKTNLYSVTIPPMIKTLKNLSAILDKAEKHAHARGTERRPGAIHMEALLNDRLVFDQFDLKRQIQTACDNGKAGAARLAGLDAPSFKDEERSVAELKERIQKTVDFMQSIKAEQIMGQEERLVSLPYWQSKMTGFGYATEYLMPNFYFHVSTAYSILRKNGVDIGKADYMGTLPFVD